MPRITSLIRKPDQKLVRCFDYMSQTHINVNLRVTLEYTTPETLAEMQEREKIRVIGARKWAEMDNMLDRAAAQEKLWHSTLASTVQKIEGMTLGKLSALLGLNDDALSGDPETPIPLDTTSTDALPADEQDGDVKTVGQAALQDITTLISKCARFRNWVENVVTDVGFFQDPNLEDRRKN